MSTNGLISFRNPFRSFNPQNFSTSFSAFLDPIIAPFWADLDTRIFGAILYRSTNDPVILNRTMEMITDINSNFSSYQPTLVVIVTWNMVPRSAVMGSMVQFTCRVLYKTCRSYIIIMFVLYLH